MQQPDEAVGVTSLSDDALAAAQAQASKDMELLVALNAKRAEAKVTEHEQEPITITTDMPARVPLNRAQRRQQVSLYAQLLASTERQEPVVNPTIVPKAKRRLRKRSRFSHA